MSEVKLLIQPTKINVGFDVTFDTDVNDFVIEQLNDGIVIDLSQALQLSDFILNLNQNRQIIDAQLKELEELKAENEKLENALFSLWQHTPDLENETDNGDGFVHAIKQAHQLIKHRLTPINHER